MQYPTLNGKKKKMERTGKMKKMKNWVGHVCGYLLSSWINEIEVSLWIGSKSVRSESDAFWQIQFV